MGVAVWCLMFVLRPYFERTLEAVFTGVVSGMLIYAVALYAISSEARKMARYRLKALRESRMWRRRKA